MNSEAGPFIPEVGSLADPVAGLRGGGQLGAGSQPRVNPKLKTPRIDPLFLGWTQIYFRKNIKKTSWELWEGGRHDGSPSWALGGAMAGLPPGSASAGAHSRGGPRGPGPSP